MRILFPILAAAGVLIASASGAVPTTQDMRPEESQEVAAFRGIVQQMREAMLRPGEHVEGWDVGGANPDGDVRRMGADRFYQVTSGDMGDSLTILTDRGIEDYAPARWRVVDSYGGDAPREAGGQVEFLYLSARYVFAARTHGERRGDVNCYTRTDHALLYEIPGAPDGADDEAIPMLFRILLLAMEGQTICIRSDGDPAQGYVSRSFLPDGRELPELNEDQDRLTIVPAAPVEALIVWRGRVEPGTPTY